nr:MMPL family transporter [Deltaproteobacteria bacterium]
MRSPASGTGDRTGDQLMTRVTGIIRDVHPERFHPRAQVGLGGDIPNAIAERDALKEEAIKTSGVAVLLILGAIVVFFRSFSALAHIGLAMLTGVGLAFSVAYFAFGYLNASTAFLGSIIAGNGINYGIIYLARYRDRRALGDSVEAALVDAAVVSRRGTQLAALAAAFAYGTLMLTSFRGFSQFGLIGGVGMICCWCATMIVVPATVTTVEALRAKLLPRRAARVASGPTRTPITGAIAWLTGRYPKHVLAVGAVLCVWAALALPKFLSDPWEYNFARLGSRGSRHSGADSWSNRAGRIFVGRSSSPDILLADRFEDVIELSSALMQRDQQRTGGRYIDHIETAWDRLGGQPAAMTRKLELLQGIRADIDAIVPHLSGDDRALAQEWRPPEGLRAPQPDELPPWCAHSPRKSGRFGTPIFVYYKPWFTPSDGRKLMIVAELTQNVRLADGRTVPTVSRSTVFAEMVRAMSSDGPRATFAAFMVVVFHSLLATRRLGPAAMVLCSLLSGVLLTVGGAAHLDVRLNFLNFVALPLTFGIGVEYAMNLYDRVEHLGDVGDGLRSVGGAVSLCSLTTIIWYGSLLVADNQALQSFGYLAVAGELACSGTAMFLLPSAMVLVQRRRERAK